MSRGQISYCSLLYNLARDFEPKRILELGCGCSTFMLRWIWNKSELVVVDDHPTWMSSNENMGGYKADKRILVKTKEDFEREILSNGKFDLIFVDCGHNYNHSDLWRVDFIKLIRENNILNEDGRIVLHDAVREELQEECNNYWKTKKFLEEKTYILRHKPVDKFFFRDDDVSIFQPYFNDFIKIFIEENVPINLEVIPQLLTDEMISLLKYYIDKYPNLFEIHLHGYNHIQNKPWSEYPESREYEEVKKELKEGDDKLKRIFGEAYFNVFTPPWNDFDDKFLPALKELSFKGISKDKKAEGIGNYHVSMDISITDKEDPKKGRFLNLDEMIEKYLEVEDSSKIPIKKNNEIIVGCTLHHSRFWKKQDNPLQTIREFIKYLKTNKIEIVKFSSL